MQISKKTKFYMKIFLMIIFCILPAIAVEDEWSRIRADTFYSFVNSGKVASRISPDFIDRGGKWIPGQELTVKVEDVIDACKLDLKKRHKKDWDFEQLSFDSYGSQKTKWIIIITLSSKAGDYVAMVCNLKGEIWPLGKVYDEFDPTSK